jgi:PAS domain S-box-containing protein
VVIECINENKSSLRGQIEFIEYNNTLLFIGSPWFGSMEDVKKNNLNIDNFAKHDPLIDLLHVLKTQEITTEELKVLLNTVNKQKNELKTLSQIAEENINAVIITDKYGVITWVNKSFEKLTGYTLSESIGKKPGHMLQGPLTDPIAKQYLKDQIKKGESFSTEILNYHKNGNFYWLRIHGRALKNKKGEVTGFFCNRRRYFYRKRERRRTQVK